jgi:hypothetical protein
MWGKHRGYTRRHLVAMCSLRVTDMLRALAILQNLLSK